MPKTNAKICIEAFIDLYQLTQALVL